MASVVNMDEDQLATWRAFLQAHSSMLRTISADLNEAELPPLPWYDVLAALKDAPENRLRQVELAERVLLSNSGMSRLLDRVEQTGLVERVTCPGDRRSFFIQLTGEGEEMHDRMWPVYARGIAENFLPALGSNPCEVRATLEAIGRQCEVAKVAEAAEAEVAG
jgi:DNA-binding MarR family transcriptional regulator